MAGECRQDERVVLKEVAGKEFESQRADLFRGGGLEVGFDAAFGRSHKHR